MNYDNSCNISRLVTSVVLTVVFIKKVKHLFNKIFLGLAAFAILIALPLIFIGTLKVKVVADEFLIKNITLLNSEAQKFDGGVVEFDATQLESVS